MISIITSLLPSSFHIIASLTVATAQILVSFGSSPTQLDESLCCWMKAIANIENFKRAQEQNKNANGIAFAANAVHIEFSLFIFSFAFFIRSISIFHRTIETYIVYTTQSMASKEYLLLTKKFSCVSLY